MLTPSDGGYFFPDYIHRSALCDGARSSLPQPDSEMCKQLFHMVRAVPFFFSLSLWEHELIFSHP